eukprot:Colp12_sorted_trinity150504_noHs@17636
MNLDSDLVGFDLIFGGNLIDRLSEPRKFLTTVHDRLNPGGVLVLTSPYTWLEEYTPKSNWVGGIKEHGENVSTYDGLTQILSAHFDKLAEPMDVEFVIRETKRKYQHTFAQLTAWVKK